MGLEAFLRENSLPAEGRKVAVSPRFLQKDGSPVLWEIRPVTAGEEELLRRQARKEGRLDYDLYLAKLCEQSVVYPDLKNVQLQNNYGVYGGAALLQAMLTGGEYAKLLREGEEVNGFLKSDQERRQEAKN